MNLLTMMKLKSSVQKVVRKSRHHVLYWWGVCSYSKLKVTYQRRKQLCPYCGNELYNLEYSGSKVFAKDRKALDYVRDSWLPLMENGVKVWRVVADIGGRKP